MPLFMYLVIRTEMTLKDMYQMGKTKKCVIPVHGEHRHMHRAHVNFAKGNASSKNSSLIENGDIIKLLSWRCTKSI